LSIDDLRVYAELVELLRDGLILVVEIEDIARPLVVDLEWCVV